MDLLRTLPPILLLPLHKVAGDVAAPALALLKLVGPALVSNEFGAAGERAPAAPLRGVVLDQEHHFRLPLEAPYQPFDGGREVAEAAAALGVRLEAQPAHLLPSHPEREDLGQPLPHETAVVEEALHV